MEGEVAGRPPGGCTITVSLLLSNTRLTLQVMRRAQSNSPRIPPKKYHSFRETRNINVDNLLLLPGYKPSRPRPPSYPAHVSPSRNQLHVPRIRITCVPQPGGDRPTMGQQSPHRSPGSSRSSDRSPGRSPGSSRSSRSPRSSRITGRNPEARGRSPARRVSQRTLWGPWGPPLLAPGVCAG